MLKTIFLPVIALTVFLAGCTASTDSATLLNDYQRQTDSINTDLRDVELIQAKWDTLLGQYNKGLTIDFELDEIGNEYIDKANILKLKIETLKTFIDKSEVGLRNLGVDIVGEKQTLDEHKGRLETNIRNIQDSMTRILG